MRRTRRRRASIKGRSGPEQRWGDRTTGAAVAILMKTQTAARFTGTDDGGRQDHLKARATITSRKGN